MKSFLIIICVFVLLFTGCGIKQSENPTDSKADADIAEPEASAQLNTSPQLDTNPEPEQEPDSEPVDNESEELGYMLNIQIGDHLLTATLEQNSSTEALLAMLSGGSITINMRDYSSMEKVGELPEILPRNDEQISTEAGDLILYQGNSFVIYYNTNSWSLTRLGKIENVTQQEIKDILGDGDVTVTLSLPSK